MHPKLTVMPLRRTRISNHTALLSGARTFLSCVAMLNSSGGQQAAHAILIGIVSMLFVLDVALFSCRDTVSVYIFGIFVSSLVFWRKSRYSSKHRTTMSMYRPGEQKGDGFR